MAARSGEQREYVQSTEPVIVQVGALQQADRRART